MTKEEFTKVKKLKRRLTEKIGRSYFVRFHMFMILSATILSGVVCSKILVWFGLSNMPLRYGIAIVFSYLMFFLFIKMWLLYIGVGRGIRLPIDKNVDGASFVNAIPFPDGTISEASEASAFNGFKGGASGGGGASGSFAEGLTPLKGASDAGTGPGAVADAAGSVLDIGDDSALTLIAIVLLVILVLSIFIVGGFLIWSAPAILSNAAFHALLVAGFARKVKRVEETQWETSILKATWWAFLIVLIFSLAFGIIAQMVFPNAVTIKDFIVLLLKA
jgi:hypothetical protein